MNNKANLLGGSSKLLSVATESVQARDLSLWLVTQTRMSINFKQRFVYIMFPPNILQHEGL